MERSLGDDDNTLLAILRSVAAQQDVIIKKLNKLESKVDNEFEDIRKYKYISSNNKTDASTNTENEEGTTTNNVNDNGTKKKPEPILPSVLSTPPSRSELPFSNPQTPSAPEPRTAASTPSLSPGTQPRAVSPPETPASQKDQILIVGDSIAHNANFRVAEIATNTTIRTAKAYAADYDLNTRKPNKNVRYVARNQAKKKNFKFVLLHSPSVHISNLNTNINNDESISLLKKVVEDSAKSMIKTATIIIRENPSVERVIIADCAPRFDPVAVDPHGLKPKLAQYSNKVLREVVAKSELKEKIHIANHSITGNEETFGRKDVPNFDGIHMYGNSGCKEFTASLIHILSNVLAIRPSVSIMFREVDNFPNKKEYTKTFGSTSAKDDESTKTDQEFSVNKAPNVFRYAVKTFNRFSSFLY